MRPTVGEGLLNGQVSAEEPAGVIAQNCAQRLTDIGDETQGFFVGTLISE
ncbi:hypothetical protein RHECNPAF_7150016 [Rhizobium etli CNPAF512]|nr:hypothetical protein RHECNPAF_7150016 [Rhizobium etli CNPAF512]